jgi:hypothetical protein
LQFDAAVLPGVREMMLVPSLATRSQPRAIDAALEMAAQTGWSYLELPRAPVLRNDPNAVELISAVLRRLFERGPSVRCERSRTPRALEPGRVAVGVSHRDQVARVRTALDATNLGAVTVLTANRLQGAEFDLVVVWHPLAGEVEADPFHVDRGRLCVLLTRHRHACIVVGRRGDRELVESIAPATPAFIGHDSEPVLDGWTAHADVFARLEPYTVQA